MSPRVLTGLRLLLVEDEFLIGSFGQDILLTAGAADVQVAMSEQDARAMLAGSRHVDAAVVDINLNGHPAFGLADSLQERGVPFVFATGYTAEEAVPDRFNGIAMVSKPYTSDMLVNALLGAIRTRRDGG